MSNLTIILTFQKLPGGYVGLRFGSSLARDSASQMTLGPFGGPKPPPWAHLGPSWVRPWSLSSVFCLSLPNLCIFSPTLPHVGPPGCHFCPPWCHVGSPLAAQTYEIHCFPKENVQLRKVTFFMFFFPNGPKKLPKTTQKPPKAAQRSPKASQRDPTWPPKPPKGTPKVPQRSPKRAKTTPQVPKEGPKLPKATQRKPK